MPPATMSRASWRSSTFIIFVYGSFGVLLALKAFFDPGFSDWISPGPGQYLFGDAGRLIQFEMGPTGIQTKLLFGGIYLRGVVLALGSLAMLTSPFSNNMCQFITCLFLPLQGCFYLLHVIYFALVGTPYMALPMLGLGGGLLMVSFSRLEHSLSITAPQSTKVLLNVYLVYFVGTVLLGLHMLRLGPMYDAELEMFMRVRDFFWYDNGKTWSSHLELPNRFYIKK
jgi:hypothetical protein